MTCRDRAWLVVIYIVISSEFLTGIRYFQVKRYCRTEFSPSWYAKNISVGCGSINGDICLAAKQILMFTRSEGVIFLAFITPSNPCIANVAGEHNAASKSEWRYRGRIELGIATILNHFHEHAAIETSRWSFSEIGKAQLKCQGLIFSNLDNFPSIGSARWIEDDVEPRALVLLHLLLHGHCLLASLNQLPTSEKYLPLDLISGRFQFPKLTLHGLPLKESYDYGAQAEERNGSSEVNHPPFAKSNPIFKACYSLLCVIAGYLLCVWGSWSIWRRWDGRGLSLGVGLYGLAGCVIYHALTLWR